MGFVGACIEVVAELYETEVSPPPLQKSASQAVVDLFKDGTWQPSLELKAMYWILYETKIIIANTDLHRISS